MAEYSFGLSRGRDSGRTDAGLATRQIKPRAVAHGTRTHSEFPCMFRLLASLLFLVLAACSQPPQSARDGDNGPEIAALTQSILDLGPGIDVEEAARAARIAYEYTDILKVQYQITDPPLIHNTKVNAGLRPRGLCWHWAMDIEARLNQENFKTLTMHRAIANAFHPILIEHSTAVIARAGDAWNEGIVLDPWRYGGILFWDEVVEDTRYPWEPRNEVNARRLRERAAKR